jgi:hypothetical protein
MDGERKEEAGIGVDEAGPPTHDDWAAEMGLGVAAYDG